MHGNGTVCGRFVVLLLRTAVRARPIRLLAALSCLSLGGCVLMRGTHFVNGETPYYLEGPHQQAPPDGFLPIGTEVRVESEADSYSQPRRHAAGLREWLQL